jgi:hypothetical protein
VRRLPVPITSFIGRHRELEEVSRLVEAERLVTLVGPGGVGKTRLAQEAANRFDLRQVPELVWVDLTSTRDAHLVLSLIAEALDVRDLGGHGLHQALVRGLKDHQMLLLLDNVEHVLDAVPEDPALLRACPGLRVLATSREPLRVQGECVFSVSPLTLPDQAAGAAPVHVARASAVALLSIAHKPPIRASGWTLPTPERLSSCADGWTGCPWPSSWPPPAAMSCSRPSCSAATGGSTCCAASATTLIGTQACEWSWTGATNS